MDQRGDDGDNVYMNAINQTHIFLALND